MTIHAELEGKRVLCAHSLSPIMPTIRRLGLNPFYDPDLPKGVSLADRFRGNNADFAMYTILTGDVGKEILDLPEDIRQRFVIFTVPVGYSINDISRIYGSIEEAGIPMISLASMESLSDSLPRALLEILAK